MLKKACLICFLWCLIPYSLASTFYPADVAVYFSPNGGAEKAVVSSIEKAKNTIYVAAYLFSNKKITHALIDAHKKGVKVFVIVDKKMRSAKKNTTSKLIENGIPTYFDENHRTMHNKVMIVDDDLVITGSFNYVDAAESKNAENLLLIKSKPVAELYFSEWQKHLQHSTIAEGYQIN